MSTNDTKMNTEGKSGYLTFKVERRHILNATCGDAEACAIAEAIKEKVGQHVNVNVGDEEIYIGSRVWKTPAKAKKFIDKFDDLEQDEQTGQNKPDRHVRPTTIRLACSRGEPVGAED